MPYAGETGADNTQTERLLRAAKMKIYETNGDSLRDRKRNEETREICLVRDVVRLVNQRRPECNNHITRKDENRIIQIKGITNPPQENYQEDHQMPK